MLYRQMLNLFKEGTNFKENWIKAKEDIQLQVKTIDNYYNKLEIYKARFKNCKMTSFVNLKCILNKLTNKNRCMRTNN